MDGEASTNEGAGRPRSGGGEGPTAPLADTEKRRETRRQRERARKARLIAQREERLKKESAVLAIAATGASLPEIAGQVNLSKSQVHRIYQAAMERIEGEHVVEYRRGAMHSLGVLKQAAWRIALDAKDADPRVRVAAMREARHVQDQMNKLQAAYPPVEVDVQGELVVRREVSVREAVSIVSRIQAERAVAGEVPAPIALGNGVGYHPPATNGSGGHTAAS